MALKDNRFHLLDGLRGLAAILVVIHHSPDLFGGVRPTLASSVVDFFFVLSGFVLSRAYGEQVSKRGQFIHLTKLRISRLYPLYLLGTFIAILVLFGSLLTRGHITEFHKAFWMAIPFAILMLPAPGFGITGNIFPLNLPAWSLFDEILANILWFLLGPRASTRVLMLIVLAGAVGLFYYQSDLNGGWNRENYYIGFFRIGYSFFLGVILYRVAQNIPKGLLTNPIIVVTLFVITACFLPENFRIFAVFLVYPLIVVLGAGASVPKWGRKSCSYLGFLSYPIYAIHVPLGSLVAVVLQKSGITDIPTRAVIYIVSLAVLSHLAAKFFDHRAQVKLIAILGGGKK